MKYVCENPECEKFGVEESFVSEIYVMRDGRLVGKNSACPCCGKTRKEINPNEQIPVGKKNISLATYTMSSPEGRREILKKRSHEHFEKEIRPVKEEKLRKTVEAFKEASKN